MKPAVLSLAILTLLLATTPLRADEPPDTEAPEIEVTSHEPAEEVDASPVIIEGLVNDSEAVITVGGVTADIKSIGSLEGGAGPGSSVGSWKWAGGKGTP